MRPNVVCPHCGQRNPCARVVLHPVEFVIYCIRCETRVFVKLTQADLVRQKVRA